MPLTKAIIIDRDALIPLPIPVMFNPPEYQLVKSNQYAEVEIPGLGSSLLQFVKGSPQTLTLDLFFDTTGSGVDVRLYTALVVNLTEINARTHAPPRLLFIWGSLLFPCVLESVTQHFDRFNALGMPLRATLSVTLKGYDLIDRLLSRIKLESADRAKQRVFQAGDSLQRIAAEEYDDPGQWRAIAQSSNIDNPLTVPSGRALLVPTLQQD